MDHSIVEKGGDIAHTEIVHESPIMKAMIKFGQHVGEHGHSPKDIQKVAAATGEIPMIKIFETPWNSEGIRAYGVDELGVIREGKFEEGFKQNWSINIKGKPAIERETRISASITADLQHLPNEEEAKIGKLSHTDLSVTIHKLGEIYLSIDSEKYPEVEQIPGMIKGIENMYSYSGSVVTIPEKLEEVVLRGLTTIVTLINPPALESPKS